MAARLVRLNAGLQDELSPTPRSLWWINACAIVVTIVSGALAYQVGLERNMHRVAPDSIDALAQTVAIDLSHKFYGTTGYVGRSLVLEALLEGGLTSRQNYLDKIGIKYPENVEMPDRMNKTIQDAMALTGLPKEATFANRQLFAPEANDPGYVDYVGWSFEIFGYRLEALYYFYFLVLAAAIGLYVICFRADTLPLITLAAVMVAFLMLIQSRAFDSPHLRTVHNQRFLGTLAIVSYLHLLFTILLYRKPTLSRILPTVLQTAVFLFVMFTRSSAFWLVLALALIIGVSVLTRLGRKHDEARATIAGRLLLCWPTLLLAVGLTGSMAYKSASVHPIYSIGVFLPYHMIWHNAYMGLAQHEAWEERGDKHKGKAFPGGGSDNMAWLAAVAEAEDRYGLSEKETVNSTIGGLPGILMGLHEKLIKERFLRFAINNPRFMLELYLWYKPKWLVREAYASYSAVNWTLSSLFCVGVFLALGAAARHLHAVPAKAQRVGDAALLITALMSLAAPFWTYAQRHVLGEAFLMLTTIALCFAAALLGKAWSFVRPAAPQRT